MSSYLTNNPNLFTHIVFKGYCRRNTNSALFGLNKKYVNSLMEHTFWQNTFSIYQLDYRALNGPLSINFLIPQATRYSHGLLLYKFKFLHEKMN